MEPQALPSDDDNNEDSDDEDFETDSSYPIHENLLEVVERTSDDGFVGVASKIIWTRTPSETSRLEYHQELIFYTRYKLLPKLESLVGAEGRFYLWLATEIQFEKPDDKLETCTRYTSLSILFSPSLHLYLSTLFATYSVLFNLFSCFHILSNSFFSLNIQILVSCFLFPLSAVY